MEDTEKLFHHEDTNKTQAIHSHMGEGNTAGERHKEHINTSEKDKKRLRLRIQVQNICICRREVKRETS